MRGFRFTKLEDGEEIVFGPHTSSSRTTMSVHRTNDPDHATHTSIRIVCVTPKRIIIESGDSALNIPCKEIQIVSINRNPGKVGPHTFDILRVKSKNGSIIHLDIPEIPGHLETELAAIFPNAQVRNNKGIAGFLGRLLGD